MLKPARRKVRKTPADRKPREAWRQRKHLGIAVKRTHIDLSNSSALRKCGSDRTGLTPTASANNERTNHAILTRRRERAQPLRTLGIAKEPCFGRREVRFDARVFRMICKCPICRVIDTRQLKHRRALRKKLHKARAGDVLRRETAPRCKPKSQLIHGLLTRCRETGVFPVHGCSHTSTCRGNSRKLASPSRIRRHRSN